MARELYTLLTGQNNPFRVPVDPGKVVRGTTTDTVGVVGGVIDNGPVAPSSPTGPP